MRVLRTRCSFTMISRWLQALCVFVENWDRAINKTAVISASVWMRSSSSPSSSAVVAVASPLLLSTVYSMPSLYTFQIEIVLFLNSRQAISIISSNVSSFFCDSFLFCYHSNGIICCKWTASACVYSFSLIAIRRWWWLLFLFFFPYFHICMFHCIQTHIAHTNGNVQLNVREIKFKPMQSIEKKIM